MKNQKTNKYARPVSQRAIAAVLSGLMLMSAVPAQAIAEGIQDAQALAVAQTATDGSEEVGQPATTTDTDQATTDDSAGATSDLIASAAEAMPELASIGTVDSVAKLEAAADAIRSATPEEMKLDNAEASSNEASGSATKRPWSDYNGPTSTDDTIAAIKQLFAFAGAIGTGNYGNAITAVLGFSTKPVEYSNNQLMHQLFDMENQISSLSNQVYEFQTSFNTAMAQLNLDSALSKIDGFKEFLCNDDEGFKNALAFLDQELPKYCELDENGGSTTTPCSLSTPAQRMPEQAQLLLSKAIEYMDNSAREICGNDSNTVNIERVLYRRICDGDNNVVKAQFDALDNSYNWDQETFATKKEFLALMGQMYMNAYVAENIVLNYRLATCNPSDRGNVYEALNKLGERATAVSEALYGENGFVKRAEPQGENKVLCYINGQTYDKGTYAKVSAYKQACFEQAYADGKPDDADKVATSWSVDSTFSSSQLREMIKRFNAMKAAGLAPTLEGTDRKADDVVEEMEAVGFKNVKTTGDEEGTTWAARLAKHEGWVDRLPSWTTTSDEGGSPYASLANKSIELGDPSQNNEIEEESEFRVGARITDSENWVVTNVKRPRVDGGSGWWGSHYKTYACYGEVVNVKTGEKIDDQLLYVLRNYNSESAFGWCNWHYTSTLEYYAFGALRLGTEDATIQ
ncbi:hypothetical protein [Paratractidigestivibacter sp.]|uniref:hypothetical protein n=1 Tax=Paratractidigestivibacter sp. TaxID=2847316 RepID=UPI002AC9CC73|nr:hypothetical protein [Paratractidigestivibacter sp.]